MSSNKNKGNAVGAKTARACDCCIRNRARWYCAADDAFLCQACDSSVHSANPLARRHHRVRLKIISHINSSNTLSAAKSNIGAPSWHKGFAKKPRTPRHGKHTKKSLKSAFNVVPEVCPQDTNTNSREESMDQLLYRVPATPSSEQGVSVTDERKVDLLGCESAIEIAEFSADVESLLGKGLESEFVGMEELELVGTKEVEEHASWECCVDGENVKVEDEALELGFHCGKELNFSLTCEDVKEKVVELDKNQQVLKENDQLKKKILLLQLDYEAVISAWKSQKSPWTTAHKPDLGTQQFSSHCMGTCGVEFYHPCGELSELSGCHSTMAEEGREARVLRYREKRRKRLFSKKIRYEVRKKNAEKRPRMKGRFVKRPSLPTPTSVPLLNRK
ncbi:zinc finger protein CONSTANS-LIKE 16-like [Vigna unguiculata]|uniref:zinc finger protein CONSTANS-LIKE 16-like n=1 Tax=Vigna unguiculata TaxID=3917 RepID=UPI001016FC1D|nr:zinc finger protein CONSTANS-LIKE 16-like [Vigna unguiculata]